MLRYAISVGLFASAAFLACSGGTASGGAGDRDSFIAQYCDLYRPCCVKAGYSDDTSSCRALLGALAQGTYSPPAGDTCLNDVRAAQNQPDYCSKGAPSCKQAFSVASGTAKPGEACSKTSDCAPSSEGEIDCYGSFSSGSSSGGSETRKCVIISTGKEGDACVGTIDGSVRSGFGSSDPSATKLTYCDKKDNLDCDYSAKKCVRIQEAGGPCSSQDTCVKTTYCDFTTKLCTARKPVGADCNTNDHPCVDKSYCDSTSKKCTAGLADGAACTQSESCESKHCLNGKCDPAGALDSGLTAALLCKAK